MTFQWINNELENESQLGANLCSTDVQNVNLSKQERKQNFR